MAADYTLYLVTDSTPGILGEKDICDVVESAIRGGVTVVQYRDKTSDTGELVATARRLHAVTKKYAVPLLINDRVDVALAVGCEGVHLGQDDMDIGTARKLLGYGKIIGITANTAEEAVTACEQGADYLGIGTVFSTQTHVTIYIPPTPLKTNTKNIIGPDGLRQILATLVDKGHGLVPTVCIGGINASNIPQVLFRGSPPSKPLDGVAVVSAIMAAADPEAAARRLKGLVLSASRRDADDVRKHPRTGLALALTKAGLLEMVPGALRAVHEQKPLSHNMTNLVVQNFAANVALAIGASPIMANYGEEAADLAKLGGALVINMGTVTPEGLDNYKKALSAYNAAERPVVFDPVGAGATAVRRAAVKSILSAGYIDVIKGNESEIKTVYGSSGSGSGTTESQRGVDSSSTLSDEDKAQLVRDLAEREQAIVVMTGKTDMVSDGTRVVAIRNGHEYMGMVTGTGCTLGTAISAVLAVCPAQGDRLVFVVAGILLFEIAAEQAAAKDSVQGPGTFVPGFLDSLYGIRAANAAGDFGWLSAEKVSFIK
ncbi:hydroxyethylthiazole kinase [Diaporthe helianthi]|uniref:Hydroxyethylthiazole kinase n=1 Tax=Diaporthe helianthi TaxID=158607 RepID=A0A2P5HV29_DIAHE|nr:hydroxyethylthiazole kinase [Diaporthe helianthi]